ncbi:MAG: hypothetical protein JO180_08845 [Gemmatirosa sp.]|nr:hypothetical protein [Gemmatirosa sp.]
MLRRRTLSIAVVAAMAYPVDAQPPGRDSAGAFVRAPAGADSAAVSRWVAQRRKSCRGRFTVVLTQFATADSGSRAYRVRDHVEGIVCAARRPRT